MVDLNMEAERAAAELLNADELAAFHRFCECCEDFDSGGYDVDKAMMVQLARIGVVRSTGFGRYETTKFGDIVRARRAAPVVADDGLPPLPAQHEELQAYWECEDCNGRGHDGEAHWQGHFQPPEPFPCGTCEGSGRIRTEAYTAEQVREVQQHAYQRGRMSAINDYQRAVDDAIAADRAARAQQQAQSVDTSEFQAKVSHWLSAREYYQSEDAEQVQSAWHALIAYIDGRTAGAADVQQEVTQKELLRAMDKWGAAGFVVNERAVNFLNYFLRERAAAPSPQQGKEGA